MSLFVLDGIVYPIADFDSARVGFGWRCARLSSRFWFPMHELLFALYSFVPKIYLTFDPRDRQCNMANSRIILSILSCLSLSHGFWKDPIFSIDQRLGVHEH